MKLEETKNMKSKNKFLQGVKRLFVAGLIAGPILAFSAKAADNQWSPADTFTDGSGNQYGYFNDLNNWSLGVVPAPGDGNRTIINGYASNPVTCVITND